MGDDSGFPATRPVPHLSMAGLESKKLCSESMHSSIANPLLNPYLASQMARDGDFSLTSLHLELARIAARVYSSPRDPNRGLILNPLQPRPNPVVGLLPPAVRPSLTRQNASPKKEFPVTNYFAPTSPDTVPLPTTGFTAPDAPLPKPPKQPKIQPRNTLVSLSVEDGLNIISAADPGDFFFKRGSEFDLPPPQIAVETPNKSRLSSLGSSGLFKKLPVMNVTAHLGRGQSQVCTPNRPIHVYTTESENPSEAAAYLAITQSKQMMDLCCHITKASEGQSFAPHYPARALERLAVKHYQNMMEISEELNWKTNPSEEPNKSSPRIPLAAAQLALNLDQERLRLRMERFETSVVEYEKRQAARNKSMQVTRPARKRPSTIASCNEAWQDMEKFAANFKLSTLMPADIAAIIAKDPAKQRKAQENAKAKAFNPPKPVESYRNSNAELLQRLRKADRKVAKQKVETLLSRRVESGLQEAMEEIAANDDLRQFFNFLSNATGDYYDLDRALGSLKDAMESSLTSKPFEENMRPCVDGRISTYRNQSSEHVTGRPCQKCAASKEQSNDGVRPFGYQSGRNYEELSAIIAERMAVNRATTATAELYGIQRETPLHLSPKPPVLRLRPSLADETKIIPKPSPRKGTEVTNNKPKTARRGSREGKKHRKRITPQAPEPTDEEESTSAHNPASKEEEPSKTQTSPRSFRLEDYDDGKEWENSIVHNLFEVQGVIDRLEDIREQQTQRFLQAERDAAQEKKKREDFDLVARLVETEKEYKKLTFKKLHAALKKQRQEQLAARAEALLSSTERADNGDEEWINVEREEDGEVDEAPSNEIQENGVEIEHIEEIEAEVEDEEEEEWNDVEEESEEEFYNALVVQDDFELL